MKLFLVFNCCFMLAIYCSEDLLGFKFNPVLDGGQTEEDNLKITPAKGINAFSFLFDQLILNLKLGFPIRTRPYFSLWIVIG